MASPSYWTITAQGFFLLWAALHFGPWNLCSSAEPGPISGAPISEAPISGAPLASNSTVNSTTMMPLTCQTFQCFGERCYQEEAHGNNTQPCHNATHCELYRFNSTSYTAQCSSECGSSNATEMCMTNGSVSMNQCTVECCALPNCLSLNATAYGDLPPTTTPAPTTTTTKAPPKNGKVCSAFTCHGDGCYKGQKHSVGCTVGFDFCEMKKTGPHYVAGCSKNCRKVGRPCGAKAPAPCFQECCNATAKVSCLKLDGKVHFNHAGSLAPAPLLQFLSGAALLGLNYALRFSLGSR